jgi:hypothetical protein
MKGGVISGNTGNNGGGVDLFSSPFTMQGGEISGNTAASGGGVLVRNNNSNNTVFRFRIVNGIIYGSDEAEGVRNTGWGAALYKMTGGIVEYGTFDGEEWDGIDLPLTPSGSYGYTNNTIKVEDGVLQ